MKKMITITILSLLSATSLLAAEIYAVFDVKAKQSAELSLSSGGVIETINVDVGDSVKKGDVLLTLDNGDLIAAVKIAQANYDTALTSYKFAKRAYDRQSKVKELIDQAELDKYTLDFQKAKSALAQTKANLDYQQAMLDKTRLIAPFDGVISSKETELGNAVSGGNPKTLFGLQSQNDVKLLVSFDASHWKSVKVGQTYKYKVDGSDDTYEGKIAKIYPSVNETTRMLQAEIYAKDIPVGLFGTGHIIAE